MACGGPERPAGDPSRGTGGSGPGFDPIVPDPSPAPGTEPAPAPGGPDVTPLGGLSRARQLREPVVAAPLMLDRDAYGSDGAASPSAGGRPPIVTGGTTSSGGTPPIGASGGAVGR